MFGGRKREYRARVMALLPTVGLVDGDAGVLYLYDVIDGVYSNGYTEYECALSIAYSKVSGLVKRGQSEEARQLHRSLTDIQNEWLRIGAVRPDVAQQFKDNLHYSFD